LGVTIAGTGCSFSFGRVPNDCRQVNESEREIPYRRAVDEAARGL
jgi:hypothetical protein